MLLPEPKWRLRTAVQQALLSLTAAVLHQVQENVQKVAAGFGSRMSRLKQHLQRQHGRLKRHKQKEQGGGRHFALPWVNRRRKNGGGDSGGNFLCVVIPFAGTAGESEIEGMKPSCTWHLQS